MLIPKPDVWMIFEIVLIRQAHSVMTYVITMHKVLAKGQSSNQAFLGKAQSQPAPQSTAQTNNNQAKKTPSENKANRGMNSFSCCSLAWRLSRFDCA